MVRDDEKNTEKTGRANWNRFGQQKNEQIIKTTENKTRYFRLSGHKVCIYIYIPEKCATEAGFVLRKGIDYNAIGANLIHHVRLP